MSRSFDAFVSALDVPVVYDVGYICAWLADYVRCGYTARTLASRLSNLRRTAMSRGMAFPLLKSPEWMAIKDTERGLKKCDPSKPGS